MKRWVMRLVGAMVVAVTFVFLLSWLTLRASLPDLDGDFVLDGLDASATIERDADGIPTITATTREDLAFATGFAHGQDRFFQMDLIRRQSAGELSEIFGDGTVANDKRSRWHRFRSRAREITAELPASELRLFERYSDGVNAGLASLGAKPFEYFLLRVDPGPWLPEDSMLVTYTMYMRLNDERAIRDVQRGLARRILTQDVYAWMYPQGTSWDAPLMGDARASLPVPSADMLSISEVVDEAPPFSE